MAKKPKITSVAKTIPFIFDVRITTEEDLHKAPKPAKKKPCRFSDQVGSSGYCVRWAPNALHGQT